MEYQRDRRFVLAFAAFLDDLPRPPKIVVGERAANGTYVEREIETPALRWGESLAANLPPDHPGRGGAAGARLAVQDFLEMSRDLKPNQVREADRRLEAAGAETLTQARRRVWRTIPRLLERGRIRTEAEYYLLIERLNDVDDPELSPEARARLAGMIDHFTARQVKRRGPAV